MLSFLRPSFRQLLLLGFLLIAGLLGAASLRALLTLEKLLAQSRSSATHAVELSAATQLLAERSVTMERAARQFLILDDPSLHERFDEARRDTDTALRQLEAALPRSNAVRSWRAQQTMIADHLAATHISARKREAALAANFRALSAINAKLADQVRSRIEQSNTELRDGLEDGRLQLSGQLLVALLLAVGLALIFGLWLARPLKRLEAAIIALGENHLDTPIDIRGPADLRLLGQRLDWLRQRLAELDDDKTRFLRHISHELKTPLASLREGVALLEDGVAGTLTEQQREIAAILAQNVVALQSQIEDLLRFHAAAFEARQLHRQRVAFRPLLDRVIDLQRLQWQAKDLHMAIEGEPLFAQADPDKLAVVLGNLLSNAIRFSPVGGTIVFTLANPPGLARIDIRDQGPGIAPEDRNRVFEPFYQGQRQAPGARRGSGIGLSIVQEYVAAHGGRVSLLDDEPGSRFRIEIPHEN
ncbi:HAMP domain-containing histidine kinase [Chitinimonas arctica]|uniref:histidine kinase n=1 Tax=Chitinimonas arctica TaxID=2594795 RepID=A0A516SCF5_9NEIS|nr:HAMP domain-containing sensor histidine kinase [Chitinimonas arctica]QDQ25824.1 HAMP domain-containing histidine kinase [Chitinimonas arctica]